MVANPYNPRFIVMGGYFSILVEKIEAVYKWYFLWIPVDFQTTQDLMDPRTGDSLSVIHFHLLHMGIFVEAHVILTSL
jgi:hypothetical protein